MNEIFCFYIMRSCVQRNIERVILEWHSHMSAEPKWCFLNWPKCETNIFQPRTTNRFRGYVSSNQIHPLFGTFAPKLGQNSLKMGLKCLGLVWYGLVWLVCDINWSELKRKILYASFKEFQISSQTPGN